jgi:hypothetical protein
MCPKSVQFCGIKSGHFAQTLLYLQHGTNKHQKHRPSDNAFLGIYHSGGFT